MALRDIVKDSDPLIRKKSREVVCFDEKLWKLLDDMKETMINGDGVGLAGAQVGILRRLAVVDFEDKYLELVNPVILDAEGEELGIEGCLSVDKKNCYVPRPSKIVVKFQDRKGNSHIEEFEGWFARVCCHEIDHLDGILFYDRKVEVDESELEEV